MTIEQIETFLSVINTGSISAAAEALYVTQSTVSSRLQALEKELGQPLLIRAKGQHHIGLTAYGKAFIPLAGQWTALWKHTQNLKQTDNVANLTIASIDSVNNCTFVSFFNHLIDSRPLLRLHVHTFHSNEIHGLVQNRQADIGFVFTQINYPDLVSKPVYRELMYLVCHRDSPYHDGMSCDELPAEQEIYLRWGDDYQRWHDRHWSPDRYALLTVNTGSTLQRFLSRPGRWAIAPMSVISQMRHNSSIIHYSLKEAPPPRICYQVTSRYPSPGQEEVIRAFEKDLALFIRDNETICTFEDWMLQT
ncbi:MAG: LysR family transcriptional regulator [Clostridia bacterium]|nr:LysR family transcriptional regulator [Clostridia bacterium]